jgi:polar amino acid transport system substrate-binding protein
VPRSFRRRSFLVLAAVAAGIVATTAAPSAQARTLDEVLSAKKLVVGVNPTLPPLGLYDDKNEIAGFDVDMAKKLGVMLGVDVQVVPVGSPDRVPFVASGKVDAVMGAMTRTPERAKVIDFTVPIQTEVLSVLTTEAKPFTSWHDLDSPDVTLVEVRGTTPVDFIKKNITKAKVTLLDNYPDVVRALAQGRGDAMIDVIDYMGQYMKNYDVKWKILKEPIGSVDYDCIGVAKGNETLRRWLDVALFDLQQSGFIGETYKKWFGIDMVYPVPANPYF